MSKPGDCPQCGAPPEVGSMLDEMGARIVELETQLGTTRAELQACRDRHDHGGAADA